MKESWSEQMEAKSQTWTKFFHSFNSACLISMIPDLVSNLYLFIYTVKLIPRGNASTIAFWSKIIRQMNF